MASNADVTEAIWFHFLCKNVQLGPKNTVSKISGTGEVGKLSNADFSWRKAAFMLKWKTAYSFPGNSEIQNAGGQAHPSNPSWEPQFEDISCCCWGGPYALKQRFEGIAWNNDWAEVLQDPFVLVDVILDQLFVLIDEQLASTAAVLGSIENVRYRRGFVSMASLVLINSQETLLAAASHSISSSPFDFVGLANASKHIIHLREGSDAILETVSRICEHHRRYFQRLSPRTANVTINATEDALEHKLTLFKSLRLQVISQEKRMQNLINLV